MKRPSIATCTKGELSPLQDALHGVDRRALIFAAGVANNKYLLNELGSAERATWLEGRRAADPTAVNPYWSDR